MKQKIQFLIAVVMSIGVIFLASNRVAWANGMPAKESQVLQDPQRSVAAVAAAPGSVRPPSIAPIIPVTGGVYSIGGVCVLELKNMSAEIKLDAELLALDVLEETPKEFTRYLAGVCSLAYQKSGELITDLVLADGNAEICFAALPQTPSQIYVYDDTTWFVLETVLKDGMMCADASKTGKYVLNEIP